MRQLALFVCSLSVSSFALCNPLITSAILESNQLTIHGKDFGSDNPMLFWDDAEQTYASQEASLGSIVRASSTDEWKSNTNKWGTPFEFAQSEKSKANPENIVYYGTGHKNFLGNPNHPKPEETKSQLYVSWWYKPSMDPSAEGGSNKFIRIWDSPDGLGTRISWTQMHLTCNDDVTWGRWNGHINEWNHHSIYVDLRQNNIKTWINGQLIHDGKCTKSEAHRDLPLYVGLIGFDHGSSAYRLMTTAIDDIYIAKTQARVEISNSKRWSSVMLKEVLPILAWTNQKIDARPVAGKINLSNDMYVYVINNSGEVNTDGYKVDCRQCPIMPNIRN